MGVPMSGRLDFRGFTAPVDTDERIFGCGVDWLKDMEEDELSCILPCYRATSTNGDIHRLTGKNKPTREGKK